jgi:DNA adenine methylase
MKKPWTSSILRWAGSKRKLLPTLMANIPFGYQRYVEPFCGSACLFFAIHPRSAILADINDDLIHCYNILLKHPRLLYQSVNKIPNTNDQYLTYRKKDPSKLTPIERATRFIYLNRYCFNGVYRTNKKGEFNVPRGSRTGRLPSEKLFVRCSYALRNTALSSVDFEQSLEQVKKGDFVYLDPPYATSDKPIIEEYGPNSFQRADIERLINALYRIEKVDATFILSYSDSAELIDRLDPNWHVIKLLVQRHIAGFACHRDSVNEILVSNHALI